MVVVTVGRHSLSAAHALAVRPNHVTLWGNNKMTNDAPLKLMLGDYAMNTRTKYSKQLLREATEAVA